MKRNLIIVAALFVLAIILMYLFLRFSTFGQMNHCLDMGGIWISENNTCDW